MGVGVCVCVCVCACLAEAATTASQLLSVQALRFFRSVIYVFEPEIFSEPQIPKPQTLNPKLGRRWNWRGAFVEGWQVDVMLVLVVVHYFTPILAVLSAFVVEFRSIMLWFALT